MDANGFITTLKASGSNTDEMDLKKMLTGYKTVLSNLPKDRGIFALNVLCILCRNLTKVPTWRDRVDNKDLMLFSVECARGCRSLERNDRVKTLACVFHIHKHVVAQNSSVPPELMLKFSYMPFEYDDQAMLTEYCKTYWSILADRLSYIERLKSQRINITKLLPQFTDDLLKVIRIYDTVPFCANLLVFIVKKLHVVFNDNARDVAGCLVKIFDCIAKKNLDVFKDLKDKDILDLFIKFNECLSIATQISIKIKFEDVFLDHIVRSCITILGHNASVFHCFQTFYSNGFCYVFNKSQNSGFTETIFQNLVTSCESTENLGYKASVYAMYPFINQLLRLYVEYKTQNREDFSEATQINCLKLMTILMKKLRKTDQLSKCENCSVRTGLHDALRLSLLVKNFVTSNDVDLTKILPFYHSIIQTQYDVLYELRKLGCSNYAKCFRILQSAIHNTAISLNKAQYYEFSIKIFDIYLINEMKNSKTESDNENITRGLYNKSICELGSKIYDQALKDAYLSLVLGNPEPSTDKYMCLVIDIKEKMLKSATDSAGDDGSGSEVNQHQFQLLTVLDACKVMLQENAYGDLRPLLQNSKFSSLLHHEFRMYAKIWPSTVLVAGVWRSLNDMVRGVHDEWLPVPEQKDDVLRILYSVVLETPTVVRTIHSDYFKEVVVELVRNLEDKSGRTLEEDIVFATLLFLKSEYDLTEASQKYGWKATEHTVDPDQGEAIRTFPQEHDAVRCAVRAVDMWTCMDVERGSPLLRNALQTAQVFVHQFLHMQWMVHALQLACICCKLALLLGDKEAYIQNAGVIVYHAERGSSFVDSIVSTATSYIAELLKRDSLESVLCFMSELAMYYNKLGYTGASANIVRFVQARILQAYEKQNANLGLAVGRFMEMCYELFGHTHTQTILSAVNNIQRHYIAVCNNESSYSHRRTRALRLKQRAAASGALATRTAARLMLVRRARAAAAAALPRAGGCAQGRLHAAVLNVWAVGDAQIKIDNRLKDILGLQPTNETQPSHLAIRSNIKHEVFTPKQEVETMLENTVFKKIQTSPSLPCITIPAFKMPEFFQHSDCDCYACDTLYADVIACHTCALEAAVYFRGGVCDIARSYFDGAAKMFDLALSRFKKKVQMYKLKKFDESLLCIVSSLFRNALREYELEFLIHASFFELSQNLFDSADDKVIRIHEIMSEMRTIDPYLKNDVLNLLVASARLRNVVRTREMTLESEFEALKLSPDATTEIPTTPETKCVPQSKVKPKIVNDEELPHLKRKVIKLNLDEASDDLESTKPVKQEKPHFKIPIPMHTRPVLENITPRTTRSKPDILLTQASLDIENTPAEFFTPQSTPHTEQFFTPVTSIKTYSKRSNVVKNLEAEFSTPKADKATSSVRKARETKTRSKKVESTEKVDVREGENTKRDSTKRLDVSKVECIENGDKSAKRDNTKRVDVSNVKCAEKGDCTQKVESTKKVQSTKKEGTKVETGSLKNLRDKRSLKRATSPGKLVKEEKEKTVTRSRRKPADDGIKPDL